VREIDLVFSREEAIDDHIRKERGDAFTAAAEACPTGKAVLCTYFLEELLLKPADLGAELQIGSHSALELWYL